MVTTPSLVKISLYGGVGGAVASWLVRSSPDRAVRVPALAGDIVLCCVVFIHPGTSELNAGG